MIRRIIARLWWAVSPWKLVTTPKPSRPTVLIGAPHTSNWDFVLMLAIAWYLGIDVRWLGKHTLFRSWYGGFFRAVGGIPVDRSDPSRVVGDVVARIQGGEVFGLVITPDGTRTNKTGFWKSGFYRIAQQTGMDVTLGYVDQHTMTTGLGPTITLTGNVAEDMDVIREYYRDKAGVRPEKRVEPRLRDETGRAEG